MKEYWQRLGYDESSIDFCEDERILNIGAIQEHSYLVVLSLKKSSVVAASANVEVALGTKVEQLLGKELPFIREGLTLPALHANALSTDPSPIRCQSENGETLWCYCHTTGDFLFLEFEEEPNHASPGMAQSAGWFPASMLESASVAGTLEDCVAQTEAFSGFDRVMAYQFEPSGDGHVVAEVKTSDLEPFIGLRYPKEDIPMIARKALLESDGRWISDSGALPVPIITARGLAPSDIDLRRLRNRASSPFHIKYLQNMGVKSSLSIPIEVGRRLWGLITCHNYQNPVHLSLEQKAKAKVVGKIVSTNLERILRLERIESEKAILELCGDVMSSITGGDGFESAFQSRAASLLDLTKSSGMIVKMGDRKSSLGECPEPDTIRLIEGLVSTAESMTVWQTRRLQDLCSVNDPKAVGVLAVPLAMDFSDYLIWFRPAGKETIQWAGKKVSETDNSLPPSERLSPRGSFKLWEEIITDQALEWRPQDIEAAQFVLFSFVKDIFKRASELASANNELERLTKAKDEFIGTISHELRTPLNALVGWIEILKGDPTLSEDAKEAVNTLERNAKNQISLVNDLLDASRIASGKLRVRFIDDLDIVGLTEEVILDAQPTAVTKSVKLTLTAPEALIVTGDPDRLRQIIWNLVTNAIKFNVKGGAVNIKITAANSSYSVEVSDTGKGLDTKDLNSIFDKFAQVSVGTARSSGLGLGLSIVKALVELHGGTVTASSEGEGRGCQFSTIFPVFALRQDEGAQQQIGKKVPLAALELQDLKILVIEDQEDAARALQILLKRSGANVDVELNGKAGFLKFSSKLGEDSYDIILSDIGLPEWDGYRFIEEVRSLELSRGLSPTPALALTAYAESSDRLKCLKAGFDNHLPKPTNKEELVYIIQKSIPASEKMS